MSLKRPFAAVPIELGARYRAKARREKRKRFVVPALVLTAAAILGGLVGVLPSSIFPSLQPGYEQRVSGCAVTDGDTIRCNGERIRLDREWSTEPAATRSPRGYDSHSALLVQWRPTVESYPHTVRSVKNNYLGAIARLTLLPSLTRVQRNEAGKVLSVPVSARELS